MEGLKIKPLEMNMIPEIVKSFSDLGWNKTESQYSEYFKEQELGVRSVFAAYFENCFSGYLTIKWNSDYGPFQEKSVPEINDLNVLPIFRKKGIATALIKIAETEIQEKGFPEVGIGVGMTKEYGSAQRRYTKLGYVPDGLGLTHNCRHLGYGESVKIDDDLVLWFTKTF